MGNKFSKLSIYNDDQEDIKQQIVNFYTKRVNDVRLYKNYIVILNELDQVLNILTDVPAEDGLNLYQALVLDTLLHCNYDVMSQISASEIVVDNTIELFQILIELVNKYFNLFDKIELNKLPEKDFGNYKQSLEISYDTLVFFKSINEASNLVDLEIILINVEEKRVFLETKNDNDNGLSSYKKLILELLKKGVELQRHYQKIKLGDSKEDFVKWLSSKFESYASVFEHIPRNQLPYDYNSSKSLFKMMHDSNLLINRLESISSLEEISDLLKSLETFKTKYNFVIEGLNNELLFRHDLVLNAILNKAIDTYDKSSENLTIEQSAELLKKLLDNFQATKISSTPNPTNVEWIQAISEYQYQGNFLEKNYYHLRFKIILLSEEQDLSAITSLSEELKDTLKMEISENELDEIFHLYKICNIENISDLEKVLSFIDSTRSILDKYVIDTGLSLYPRLLIQAISCYINIDNKDIYAENIFSKQLAKYTEFFKSLDNELFADEMKPFINKLKNYGVIIAINEEVLDMLLQQLVSSEKIILEGIKEEQTIYNGQIDLTILSDQITIFRDLLTQYEFLSPDIKEIIHERIKIIIVMAAGSFEQGLASKNKEAINAVIKVLFIIDTHLQTHHIEGFDNHFAMKVCGHLTHRLYFLREGENENTIPTEHWLKLAEDVISSIERNGIENYRTVINYKGDLYRNLKAIYTIQPPRERYISDDSNSIAYQLHKRVAEIITLKNEFVVGPSASLEERQKNIPLRALACMVKKDPTHLNNAENILVHLTGEEQLNMMEMVLSALKLSNAWHRVISIVENESLAHLKNTNEVIFSYICAKINIGVSLTKEEIKHYEEIISDLESIFLAEVFINIGDYKNALFQINKINLAVLDQDGIKYTLLLMDRFCHTFLYSKNSHNSNLFHENIIETIEGIYNKFAQIEFPSFDSKTQMQYRLLKLHLYCNNEAKMNELISTLLAFNEDFREYQVNNINSANLNEIQKENLVTFLGTCQLELTVEEAIYAKTLFEELTEAVFEEGQISRDKQNEIVFVNEISIEQKLDNISKQNPAKKDKTFSKPIFSEIKEAIEFLEPKHLMKLKSSIVQTDHYHIDVALMPGTTNMFKLEIQGKNKDRIDNQTVAQVIYDPLMLESDLEIIGSKIISLLSIAAQFSNKAEDGRYYCREYDVRHANQFEKLHRGSSLQSQKTPLDYMFDYNELALNNLLKVRLESVIEGTKALKSIKVLETSVVDIHNNVIPIENKIIALNEDIISIYKTDKAVKHVLVPILIPVNALIYHWVGVAVTKEGNELFISYLDSENNKDNKLLQTLLIYHLQKSFPYLYISYKQIPVEQQKYNNCGLELIENFIFYLTGERASQEEAPYVHSDIWVQKLILEDISLSLEYTRNPVLLRNMIKDEVVSLIEKENVIKKSFALEYLSPSYISNFLGQLDIIWQFKKIYYYQEVNQFNEMLKAYNIDNFVDVLRNPSDFRKVLLKLHPDKGGNPQDFIFVKDLQEKFSADLNIEKMLEDNIKLAQVFAHKTTFGFKILDSVVDSARLIYEPTLDNAKKLALDTTYIYSMQYGVNGYSSFIGIIDMTYKAYQGEIGQAIMQGVTTIGYMAIPYVISFTKIPYIGFIYSSAMAIYTGYSAITNAHSFCLECYSKDSALKSITAYKNVAEALSNTPLQLVYDFLSISKEYSIKLNKINYEKEKTYFKQQSEAKGEFGSKLYNYIYIPVLKEKYDLLNKIIQGFLTIEEAEALKTKHIKITIENISYDHCMEVKDMKKDIDNSSEYYYCYNEEQQILDCVIIGETKDIEGTYRL